jgi:hypothetical protein
MEQPKQTSTTLNLEKAKYPSWIPSNWKELRNALYASLALGSGVAFGAGYDKIPTTEKLLQDLTTHMKAMGIPDAMEHSWCYNNPQSGCKSEAAFMVSPAQQVRYMDPKMANETTTMFHLKAQATLKKSMEDRKTLRSITDLVPLSPNKLDRIMNLANILQRSFYYKSSEAGLVVNDEHQVTTNNEGYDVIELPKVGLAEAILDCDGFANIFAASANNMGFEAAVVIAQGVANTSGDPLGHAFSAINITGHEAEYTQYLQTSQWAHHAQESKQQITHRYVPLTEIFPTITISNQTQHKDQTWWIIDATSTYMASVNEESSLAQGDNTSNVISGMKAVLKQPEEQKINDAYTMVTVDDTIASIFQQRSKTDDIMASRIAFVSTNAISVADASAISHGPKQLNLFAIDSLSKLGHKD